MERDDPMKRRVSGHAVAAGMAALAALATWGASGAWGDEGPDAAPASAEPGLAAFDTILEVVRHPRCMNCHTLTAWPRQGDLRQRHILDVLRGPDDQGPPGMACSTCHGESNDDLGGVPGAPHWGLAPLSMGWEHMSGAEICSQLLDPARNGGKTVAELHEHMTEDPLVVWGWEPGLHPGGAAREPVPIDLVGWRAVMTTWVEAGAPCPEGDREP